MEIIYLTHTARMKGPLLVRSDTPCASYHLGPIHEHTSIHPISIHPIPRIIRDQLTHSCINPNTQTFPLLLDWKSENRTKDWTAKCLLNKDACRGRPKELSYILVVPSAMDIHVEARWRDGDMQGGDTLACACLLDLPPLPRGMEFRCFLAGIYARVNPKATSRDRSGRGRCVSGVVFI